MQSEDGVNMGIESMKILLHSPLHPSFWNYLMRLLPEHKWYIEPELDFAEGSIPYHDLKFKVLPRKKLREKIDLQIICLHLTPGNINQILKVFPIPIVWVEYWESPYQPKLPGIYPLVYASQTHHRINYPDLRHAYFVPSSKIWDQPWIGDQKEILIPSRQYYPDFIIKETVKYLRKKKLPIAVATGGKRHLPFPEWQDYFIHSRALFDLTLKKSSGTLLEAMSIGMPIVVPPFFDYPKIIRNKIDGFVVNSGEEAFKRLTEFLDDYSLAKEWGNKAKLRANDIINPQKSKKFWNKAFSDAISVYENTGSWE